MWNSMSGGPGPSRGVLSPPPPIKVLEALSAVADGRVEIIDEKRAKVSSSDGTRVYEVYLDVERGLAYSTDNGTLLRGYVGYPLIAFMMVKRILPFDESVAAKLSGIKWRELNEKYKRYYIVERIVKSVYESRGGDLEALERLRGEVMRRIKSLELRLAEEASRERAAQGNVLGED